MFGILVKDIKVFAIRILSLHTSRGRSLLRKYEAFAFANMKQKPYGFYEAAAKPP